MPEFTAIRSEATYVDAHGVTIHYFVWKAGEPKAVVQLVHGLGEHVLRYEHLAQELVTPDTRCTATTTAGTGGPARPVRQRQSRLGKLGPGGMRATMDAVRQFTAMIREREPGLPLAAIGQSWGSLMMQVIVNKHPEDWDAVVLTGTAYRTLRRMKAAISTPSTSTSATPATSG